VHPANPKKNTVHAQRDSSPVPRCALQRTRCPARHHPPSRRRTRRKLTNRHSQGHAHCLLDSLPTPHPIDISSHFRLLPRPPQVCAQTLEYLAAGALVLHPIQRRPTHLCGTAICAHGNGIHCRADTAEILEGGESHGKHRRWFW